MRVHIIILIIVSCIDINLLHLRFHLIYRILWLLTLHNLNIPHYGNIKTVQDIFNRSIESFIFLQFTV